MRRLLLPLITLTALVGCGPSRSDFWDEQLNPLLVEFEAQDQLAASAPRGQLAPVIGEMSNLQQQMKDLFESTGTPNCAIRGMSALLTSTSSVISAAEDWATTEARWSTRQLADHDQRVAREWTTAYEGFHSAQATIIDDCGF